MAIDRRGAIQGAAGAALAGWLGFGASPASSAEQPFAPPAGPRSRVVFVNDLSGDLDGLYAAVHQILSRSSELRGIVGTRTGAAGETADRSVQLAVEILGLMGLAGKVPVHAGAEDKLAAGGGPLRSPGALAIVEEAMRADPTLPLYVAVGGGLTEAASALMLEPRIAERMTLVWIGGDAYPAGGTGETNFNIDPVAAQFVFNESRVPIWQVPRSVYATCVVSDTELQALVAPQGAIGAWLYRKVLEAPGKFGNRINMGETWTLGDNPLVALTALADWVPSNRELPLRFERTGSSLFDEVVAPRLNGDGTFTARKEGRKIRIYRSVDTRLMFGDLFAKLRMNYPAYPDRPSCPAAVP